jgi:Retrotransposon gag protein/Zinc knuckle
MPGGSDTIFPDPIPPNVGHRHEDHPAPAPDQPRQASSVLGDNRGARDDSHEKKHPDIEIEKGEEGAVIRDDLPDLMDAVFEHEDAVRQFIDTLERRRPSRPRPQPVVGPAAEYIPQPDGTGVAAAAPLLPDPNQIAAPVPLQLLPVPAAGVVAGDRENQLNAGLAHANFARAVVKAPEVFSGEYTYSPKGQKEATCTEWCDTMDRYLRLNHVPEEDQVTFVQTYLRGGALSLSTLALQQLPPSETGSLDPLALRPTIKNWRWLRDWLISQFQPLNTHQSVRDELDVCRQGDRSVAEYLQDFHRLVSRLPTMSKEERLHYFRRGLFKAGRTEVDRQILRDKRTLSIEEAARIASGIEFNWRHERQLQQGRFQYRGRSMPWYGGGQERNSLASLHTRAEHTGDNTEFNGEDTVAMIADEVATEYGYGVAANANSQLNAVTSSNSFPSVSGSAVPSPSSASIECWNCGGLNHISRNCPNPRKPGRFSGGGGRGGYRGRGGGGGYRGRGGNRFNGRFGGQGKDGAHKRE